MKNSICFTGKLNHFTRKEAQSKAKEIGFDVYNTVKPGLTYLVMADSDSTSSKSEKARKLGIKMISEMDFIEMTGEKVKRTIYDILEESDGEKYTKSDLKELVDTILGDCVYRDCEDEMKKKGLTESKLVNIVIDKLTDGSIEFDESWECELELNIESLGYDIAEGNEIGTQQSHMEAILGKNEDGSLKRIHGDILPF